MVAGVFTWKDLLYYAYIWLVLTVIFSIYFNAFVSWLEGKAKGRGGKQQCTTSME